MNFASLAGEEITSELPTEYYATGDTWGAYLKFLETHMSLKGVQVLFLRVLVTQYFKKPLSSPLEPQQTYPKPDTKPGYFVFSNSSSSTITIEGHVFSVQELFNLHYSNMMTQLDKIPTEELPQYLDIEDPFFNLLVKCRLEHG